MIYPKGTEVVADSSPLTISKAQRTAMVAKAKTYLPISKDGLEKALNQFYIYGQDKEELKAGHTSKHYTSAQLKDIVDQVVSDVTPETKDEVSE